MTVNIRFQFQIITLVSVISFSTLNFVLAQDKILNKYGLWVIKDIKTLKTSATANSGNQMIDIKTLVPDILLDLRYTTTNNFMKKKLYPFTSTTYLRYTAAKALQQVQIELNEQNLGLKIFDAYRPYSVTEKMWEPIQDVRYVADPKNGSGHNRGIAVDLTLINFTTKAELPMGTGFDNYSDTAHQTFTALPEQVIKNRTLLKSIMEKNNFKALETEWWHYYLPNTKDFELLDISFKNLRKIKY
jgi:D-alanyl-D-alanine dipeptidase